MKHDLTKWTGVSDLIAELTACPRAMTEAECSAVIARYQFNEGTIKRQIKEMDRLADEVRKARGALQQPEHPKVSDDGWIEWKGGECPVPPKTVVEYRLGDGHTEILEAYVLRWEHNNPPCDIIAYRIVTPAKTEPSHTSGIAMKGAADNPLQAKPEPKLSDFKFSDFEEQNAAPSHDLRTVAGGGYLTLEVGKTYRDGFSYVLRFISSQENGVFRNGNNHAFLADGRRLEGRGGDLIELVEGK